MLNRANREEAKVSGTNGTGLRESVQRVVQAIGNVGYLVAAIRRCI